jgi:hypothetical protein
MKLTRWLGLCAVVGGAGVVLSDLVLGWVGVDTDLRIMGGAVTLIGVLTILIGDLGSQEVSHRKGSSP